MNVKRIAITGGTGFVGRIVRRSGLRYTILKSGRR